MKRSCPYGPVQTWDRLPDHKVVFVAQKAGPVRSSQGVEALATYSFVDAPQFNIVMVPGGGGTRKEVDNEVLLDFIRKQDKGTELTISVCTGAALLARTGLLDGRKATTSKLAYKWATSQSDKVERGGHARWVVDGKYITSSGVSAGTDMALAVVEKIYGREAAERREGCRIHLERRSQQRPLRSQDQQVRRKRINRGNAPGATFRWRPVPQHFVSTRFLNHWECPIQPHPLSQRPKLGAQFPLPSRSLGQDSAAASVLRIRSGRGRGGGVRGRGVR